MTEKAPKAALEALHGLVAASMSEALQSGEPVTAAQWTAIANFLKTNGVSATDGLGADADDSFARLMSNAKTLIDAHNGDGRGH